MSTRRIADFAMKAHGDLTTVNVEGRTIAFTVQDGKAYACDDARTHKRSLAGGEVAAE